MDNLNPEQRHINMSHIRSKDTSPEKIIRKSLHQAGFRYRICDKKYPGKPDIILPRYYAVIFVNGCFWHAHENCKYFVFPKSNQEFWKNKLAKNIERDKKIIEYYQDHCWRICIVWTCCLKGKKAKQKIDNIVNKIIEWLEDPAEPLLELSGN